MTIRVFQFWNDGPATIREVALPESVVNENYAKYNTHGTEGVRIGLLNAVFHYGQNEVQSQQAPSVSVGDIIELMSDTEHHDKYPFGIGIEFWVVANFGFENYGREKHFLFTQSRPGSETIRV